jgi:hypothetical protein
MAIKPPTLGTRMKQHRSPGKRQRKHNVAEKRAARGQAAYVTCPLCNASMLRGTFLKHARERHQIEDLHEAHQLLAPHDGKLFNLEIRPISRPFSKKRRKTRVDPGKYGNSVLAGRPVQGGAPGSGKRR